MNRRHFFLTGLAGAGIAGLAPHLLAAEDDPTARRFLLSSHGCGRATGYAETNKIVTRDDKTHVAWLDSVPEGFRVRVRTLDCPSGEWSPVYTVGEAYDNHGGPALTVDSGGFLHIVYYPHHHPFRYRKSKRPGDASEWEEEIRFGQRCTYPTMMCGADDTLYLTCRRSQSPKPWQMELWTKRPDGGWEDPAVIARSRHPGYAHFQESLAWGPDHRTLHLCCRFHEKTDGKAYGKIQTVGYMVSGDFGATWRRSDGSRIETPATAETIEVLASGGVDQGRVLRAGAMAVDAKGRPHLVYSIDEDGRSETILATLDQGKWHQRKLSPYLPEPWKDWGLAMPGGMTFNARGEPVVAATMLHAKEGEKTWGHPTSEVVSLISRDGGRSFDFRLVSRPDQKTAHWLPNIEKPTGHNRVPAKCGIIYLAGPPGKKNTEIMSNGVWWFTP